MRTNLIIVADLGLLRAYRVVQGVNDRQPHLELLDELCPPSAHQKLAEQVTDQSGRFTKGRGPGDVLGDLPAGEQHNLELEQRRRLTTLLADRIAALLAQDGVSCSLAVSAPIHHQLLEQLPAPARTRIERTVALDLTKEPPGALLERFKLKEQDGPRGAQRL